jgi:DNA-binding FadR family transcriptional regulator
MQMNRSTPGLSRFDERVMSAHDRIVSVLGSEILKGTHRPGGNLPAESALIARFGVSRTVMREVTKTLAAKGLVISKTRIGTRVRDPVEWNLFDADVLAWRVRIGLDSDFVGSLTEIRRAVEPAAAALAAQRRSRADVVRLKQLIGDMALSGHSRKSFAAVDLALHLQVGVASGNPLMRSLGSVIEAALLSSFMYSSPVDDPRQHSASVRNHAAIVDAIEARDAQQAAAAMLNVINVGARRIESKRLKEKASRARH